MLKRKLIKTKIMVKQRLLSHWRGHSTSFSPLSSYSSSGGGGHHHHPSAATRSLYLAILFGAFFAVMLFLQVVNVGTSGGQDSGSGFVSSALESIDTVEVSNENDIHNNRLEGLSGRFTLWIGSDSEVEVTLPPSVAQEMKRIIQSAKFNADSLIKEVNQRPGLTDSMINSYSSILLDSDNRGQGVGSNFDAGDNFASSIEPSTLDPFLQNVSTSLALNIHQLYSDHLKDGWQPVSGLKEKFLVYSAYFDNRPKTGRVIRVIAATRTVSPESVSCLLWYSSTYLPKLVPAINKRIRENWNLRYSAYFVLCQLGENPIPDAVSVLNRIHYFNSSNGSVTLVQNRKRQVFKRINLKNSAATNQLFVHNHPDIRKKFEPKDFAVCVKPLHYEFGDVPKLVEFIELNRLLGVSHFIFYNHSVSPMVSCILKEYISSNVVTLLPWTLDMKSQVEIRTEGLFAALNDCLYRTMYKFKYVLMIDLDEYIVPHRNKTLSQLMDSLSSQSAFHPARNGAFSFQNAFFYLQWPDDPEYSRLEKVNRLSVPLVTLRKTRRKSQLHRHKVRSKLILNPESVIEVGNHFVWEHVRGKSTLNVGPDYGLLHHYRICEFGGNDCIKQASTVDRKIYTHWKDLLINSVELSMRKFLIKCDSK